MNDVILITGGSRGIGAAAARLAAGRGYRVAVNDPYLGMELISRYCDPAAGRHSLQVEVKRSLYMHERKRERHQGFETLKSDLGTLCAAVADFARAEVG